MYLREKKTILWCPWNSIHNLWTYLPLGKGFRPWKCIKSLKSSSLTDWMVMMSMKPSSKIKNHDPWVMGTGPWAGCDTQVIVNACWPLATLKTIAQVLGYNFRSRRHQSTHLKSSEGTDIQNTQTWRQLWSLGHLWFSIHFKLCFNKNYGKWSAIVSQYSECSDEKI